MFRRSLISASPIPCMLILLAVPSAPAEESPLYAPQPEHGLLKRFYGEWRYVKKSVPERGDPQVLGSGELSAELLGDFFVVSRWKGDAYGDQYNAVQTIGFDTSKKKYTGTWVDSIMSHLWQFDGSLDESGKMMTLVAQGPSPDGETTTFRERYQFNSPDSITVFAETLMDDGKWVRFITTKLTRKES